MRHLSKYPPIPPAHPWFDVEQQRLLGVRLWSEGKLVDANQCFILAIQNNPQSPFVWATYHRFLHDVNGQGGLPKDHLAVVPQSAGVSAFSFYRFFGRCQVATAVAARGWNGFEQPCPLVLAKWLRSVGGTFIDVGANSGYYSFLAIAAGARRAIAFEPFAPAADVLRSNIELNIWIDRIEVKELAIADRACITPFYLPLQSHGLLETSASQDPTFRAQHSFSFDAQVITLDSLIDDVTPSDHLTIKVDVEGVAPTVAALKGAYRLARERRPLMMVEYLKGPVDGLHQFLNDLSYTSIVYKPNGTGFIETQITPQPDQLNHFFVPTELVQTFVKAMGP
jgi:FkbM family methyltransferase